MKCFNHPEREAVAICRACGKAVCHGCAVETENGMACGQSCAVDLAVRNDMLTGQAAQLKNTRRMNLLGAFFSIGMGLLFFSFSFAGHGLVYDLIGLLGLGFAGYGVAALLVNLVIMFKTMKTKKQ